MTNKMYSTKIADAVKKFLNDDDWHYSFNDETGTFRFTLSLSSKLKNLAYHIRVKESSLLVYGVSPVGADENDPKMMAAMADFVCRANFGLRNGCFELDMDDGEIRFRSYVDCDELAPSREVIKNSIYCTAIMFERYAPGILEIIFGNTTAKAAIEKCESDSEETPQSSHAEQRKSEPDEDMEKMQSRLVERFGSAEMDGDAVLEVLGDIKMAPFTDGEGGNA